MRRSLVCVGVLAWIAASALAADWPQWRGPDRDNVAADAKLPEKWPEKPPDPLWKLEIGEGYSSPVLAGGKLFIMGRTKDQEVCYCVNPDDGEVVWKHAYDAPYKPHPAARSAGSGPKSTVCVDGDRLYCLGINGMFHCLGVKDGKPIWKHDFTAEFWGVEKDEDGYDTWCTYCGASSSPLVDGDRVILSVGGKKAGALTAFDRKSGEIVWKALEDRGSYASPIVAELAETRQLIGYTGLRMAGLDAKTGKLLWEHPVKVSYEQTIVTPLRWKDHVIVCTEGTPTVALKIAPKADKRGKHIAMTEAWQNKELRCYMATPTIAKDHLFGLDQSGQLVCIDLATGKTAWSKGNFGDYACILTAGERLLVLGNNGELTVLEANPAEFKSVVQWQLSKAGGTWANPAVVGSRLYIKDKSHLICFDLK